MLLAEFGESYLGGKSEKTAKKVVMEDGIPYYRVRGHILIKQSDADVWRESRLVTPETPDLKSMLAKISAGVLAKRERTERQTNGMANN